MCKSVKGVGVYQEFSYPHDKFVDSVFRSATIGAHVPLDNFDAAMLIKGHVRNIIFFERGHSLSDI